MIVGEHTRIRGAEPDDARAFHAFYCDGIPRCCLLDQRHEPLLPTADELREVLSQKEMGRPVLYGVEDKSGAIRGFCSLRGVNIEISCGEVIVLMRDETDFAGPIADEVFAFLARTAFLQFRLNKVVAHALEFEFALHGFLLQHGFGRDGAQREAVFTRGRGVAIEAYSLFRAATQYGVQSQAAG